MNIKLQICGIMIMVVLIILFVRGKKLWLNPARVFVFVLASILVSLILDVVSVIMITYHTSFQTDMPIKAVCKAYLVSLAISAYFTNRYLTVDIKTKGKVLETVRNISAVMVLFASIVICLLPVDIHYSGFNDVYSFGPAVSMTYSIAVVYVALNATLMIAYHKSINNRRLGAAVYWMLLLVTAAILQFFFNNLLVIGFASAVGCLIIFIRLENPEAYIDRESGLFNNQGFMALLEHHYMENKALSIIVINVLHPEYLYERLKKDQINQLMVEVCEVLNEETVENIYRPDEWEIAVTFKSKEAMKGTTKKLIKAHNRQWEINGRPVSISFGFIEVPDIFIAPDANGLVSMIHAMRKAHPDAVEKLSMEEEWSEKYNYNRKIIKMILKAIEEDRVKVYFQPIYSLEMNQFVSAEALARIEDENGKLVPPSVFIPVAESSGLVTEIGRIVFEKTCKMIKKYRIWELGIHYIEVNLSAIQCVQRDLAKEFSRILKETGVDPRMINLEVTESSEISNKDILLDNMKALSKLGVRFSLDDFGTGFSNIEYLIDMPFDIVKFDRKLTQSYFVEKRSQAIMGGVMNTMQDIGLKIVAEGVEEKDQVDELALKEVDFIQGYYYSKPVPEDEFINFIKEKNV